jgi:hypothetical protein
MPGIDAFRREDQLSVTFEFVNLRPDRTGRLAKSAAGQPALVILHLPPQAIGEAVQRDAQQAYPSPASLSGPSRLVFRVPDSVLPAPYTIEGVLDCCARSELVVCPTALPAGPVLESTADSLPGAPVEPDRQQTAIEAPIRLILSPHQFAAWLHSGAARPTDGRYELWHTRLGLKPGGGDKQPRRSSTVRAVFHARPQGEMRPGPVVNGQQTYIMWFPPAALAHTERDSIVTNSTPLSTNRKALPVSVDHLLLSPLGAWMKLHGSWPEPATVAEWVNITTQGRDQYVKVVTRGFLYPFGHRASLISIRERESRANGPAYLYLKEFLVITEPVREYPNAGEKGHYDFPFKEVRIEPETTPELSNDVSGGGIPQAAGSDFEFRVVANDLSGMQVELHMPLVYVPGSALPTNVLVVAAQGQRVMVALEGGKPGSTTFESESLAFCATACTGTPPFKPQLSQFVIRIPAMQTFVTDANAVPFQYEGNYNKSGFSGDEVFASYDGSETAPAPTVDLGAHGERSGGLVQPHFTLTHLSRIYGPLDWTPHTGKCGRSNNTSWLDGFKLFGVPMSLLLPGSLPTHPPELAPVTNQNGPSTLLSWKHHYPPITLELSVTIAPVNGKNEFTSECTVSGVNIPLVALTIGLSKVRFTSSGGKKPAVDVEMSGISFHEDLEFLGALTDLIPLSGLSSAPNAGTTLPVTSYFNLTSEAIQMGISLALPNLTLGMFSLQNLALGARLKLPFAGKPLSIRFNFCEAESPFLLAVSCFGGGGSFAIEFDAKGFIAVEAALEFGAIIALNLGVASGSVKAVGGIYFLKGSKSTPELTAYLRVSGEVDVLGLISASLDLYLALAYANSKLSGRATMTVEVEVLFFHKSVELTVERQFAGAKNDPTFAEMIDDKAWREYCLAFAS